MHTLTILNAGTGFMRDHTDVVGNLSRKLGGAEGVDWMITAGVAAHGTKFFPRLLNRTSDVTRVQPGMLDPITSETRKAELTRQAQLFPALMQGYELGVAPKFGAGAFGLEHNVIRAVWWIQETVRQRQLDRLPQPIRVNLVGWSRGAVTCFRIAEELHRYGWAPLVNLGPADRILISTMHRLELNIFAMDPVPGAVYSSQMHYYTHTTLPPNVRRLCGIYAEDEARGGMKPLVHTAIDESTSKVLLRMPGPHDQSVEGAKGSAYSKGLTSVFKITQSLCHSFLEYNRTRVLRPDILDEKTLLEEYGKIQQHLGEYQAFAKPGRVTSVGGKGLAKVHGASTPGVSVRSAAAGTLPPNRLASPGQDKVTGVELLTGKKLEFVNDHHYQLFARLVPDFGYAGGIKPSEARKDDALVKQHQPGRSLHEAIRGLGQLGDVRRQIEQVNKLKRDFPETYKGFVALGIINA